MSRRFASRLRVAHWLKAFAVHALNVLLGFFLINACTVFCVKFDTCITIWWNAENELLALLN